MNDEGRRIGHGPWARLFASTVVGDEGSREGKRGRQLAAAVEDVRVEAGELEARVDGCAVTIAAPPISPRIWEAMRRFARGNARLEAAVEGREQSVQLVHLLEVDWDEPLIPRANAIRRACACGDEAHGIAVAYAVAARIDEEPELLLRWRGWGERVVEPEVPRLAPAPVPATAWTAGPLPEAPPVRALPVAAVLKRLGRSGIELGDRDLADVLERAYATFAEK